MMLPFEIQNDLDLFARNEELKQVRAEFTNAISKMESGSYSIVKTFTGILDKFNAIIDSIASDVETTVIPENKFQDFLNGNVTLDEYGSFDIIDYYNGLKKMQFSLYGIKVALIGLQDVPTRPITPSYTSETGVLDSLDTREFLEQGAENPVFETQQSYKYYTIKSGDTLQSIAANEYNGDTNRWIEIAQTNNLSDSDLLDTDLVGKIIKIPLDAYTTNNIISNNLVFEKFFDGTNQEAINQFNYGRDLKLVNKKLQISGTGDLRRTSGTESVIDNIQSRFDNTKGALNPLNPDWGLLPIDNSGDIPFIVVLDRILSDMESQASSDPRVVSAAVQRKKLKVDGDRMDVEMEISLIGNKDINDTFFIKRNL